MRKPHSTSKLKTLPREPGSGMISQRELIEWLRQPGHSHEGAVSYLQAEWDLKTSEGALSEFWSWWHVTQRLERAESHAAAVEDTLGKLNAGLTAERILEAGNIAFMAKASEEEDPKVFGAMAKIALANRKDKARFAHDGAKLKLEERRIKLLERKAEQADTAKATMQNTALTMEQKHAKLRETFGLA